MIKAFCIGNLTADPRIGEFNGKQVASASVAVHTPFKGENNEYLTNFVDLSTWGQVDTLAKMHKGNKIAFTGNICMKSYKKSDGTPACKLVCKADSIESLTPTPRNNDDDLFAG